jgi:hypothetical protein
VPGYTNPQALNRYSYVLNNPVKLTDPSGHRCVGEAEECLNDAGHAMNGAGVRPPHHRPNNKGNKSLEELHTGDIVTFDLMQNGESLTYNYMLGQLEDGSLGFWDLDSHTYVSYALGVNMVENANTWTSFRKTDPKTFNSYEVLDSSGTPSNLPSYDVNWTGGMDNNPGYVEIHTQVDWANLPGHFSNVVLGPALVTSFWQNAKPTVTPLSPAGYFPLTNYVVGLIYFANDGPALNRYPIIHP